MGGLVSGLLGGLFGGGGSSTTIKAADTPAVAASSDTANAPKPTEDTNKESTTKRKAKGKSSLTIDAATASSGGTGVNV